MKYFETVCRIMTHVNRTLIVFQSLTRFTCQPIHTVANKTRCSVALSGKRITFCQRRITFCCTYLQRYEKELSSSCVTVLTPSQCIDSRYLKHFLFDSSGYSAIAGLPMRNSRITIQCRKNYSILPQNILFLNKRLQ